MVTKLPDTKLTSSLRVLDITPVVIWIAFQLRPSADHWAHGRSCHPTPASTIIQIEKGSECWQIRPNRQTGDLPSLIFENTHVSLHCTLTYDLHTFMLTIKYFDLRDITHLSREIEHFCHNLQPTVIFLGSYPLSLVGPSHCRLLKSCSDQPPKYRPMRSEHYADQGWRLRKISGWGGGGDTSARGWANELKMCRLVFVLWPWGE